MANYCRSLGKQAGGAGRGEFGQRRALSGGNGVQDLHPPNELMLRISVAMGGDGQLGAVGVLFNKASENRNRRVGANTRSAKMLLFFDLFLCKRDVNNSTVYRWRSALEQKFNFSSLKGQETSAPCYMFSFRENANVESKCK